VPLTGALFDAGARLHLLKAGGAWGCHRRGEQSVVDVSGHFRPDRNRPDPVIASALRASQ
jgi:hypothetical protein